jgi:hypothetical protein
MRLRKLHKTAPSYAISSDPLVCRRKLVDNYFI